MKLRLKFLNWDAGISVAMLSEKTAQELGVHANERVFIEVIKTKKGISTIVDISNKIVSSSEIGISEELKKILGVNKPQMAEVILSPVSRSLEFIKKKLKGEELSSDEILEIIRGVVENSLSDAEISLFVSAMYQHGMSKKETIFLIKAMLQTGEILNLKHKMIVDKHSIGGISGNRTTPIVVSICAATGLIFPKTSSRAITSPAGPADVIETIAPVDLTIEEIRKVVNKTGACLAWGGGLGMAPADSKIIQIEKSLQIDPKAQLLASIMAKKLAAGSTHILIDIPYGKSAKVTREKAISLKKDFLDIAKAFKRKMVVTLTRGDEPMGDGVGPALELRDVIKVLDPGKVGPKDLEEKSLLLAGKILELTKKAKKDKGIEMAKEILYSGKAFGKFKEIISAQGGKLIEIIPGKYNYKFVAKKSSKIKEIDNKKINSLARVLGCPNDKFAGIDIFVSKNKKIQKGRVICVLYAESKARLDEGKKYYQKIKPITFN